MSALILGFTLASAGTALAMCRTGVRYDRKLQADCGLPAPANDASGSFGGAVAARRPAGSLMTLLKVGLPEIPLRMRALTRDVDGKPIPFLLNKISGEPESKFADNARVAAVHANRNCWICGNKLGKYSAFIGNPLISVTRVSQALPAHSDCAKYAAMIGLMQPADMKVALVWVCREYRVQRTTSGAQLFLLGEPEQTFWFTDARTSTYEEVQAAMRPGLDSLYAIAHESGEAAVLGLDLQAARATKLFPAHAGMSSL